MFGFRKKKKISEETATSPAPQHTPLSKNLTEALIGLRERFDSSDDLIIREIRVGGLHAAVVSMEGMIDKHNLSESVIAPMMDAVFLETSSELILCRIRDEILATSEMIQIVTLEELCDFLMSGFAAFLLDGCDRGLMFGIQGFSFRSISDPETEVTQRGSRESFVEALNINISMIRRRMRSPNLKFERIKVGKTSSTYLCLCYLRNMAAKELISDVKAKLQSIPLDYVLESGYIQPFLEGDMPSLFTQVGVTERPDTVCGKIGEGRIAVMVDGTPQTLIVPHLFIEHFQSFDDYCIRPFYATFTRLMKMFAFAVATLLPGLYVAVGTFHPELLPLQLLYKVAGAEASTPFPLIFEALLIHFIYEIMREAGLRLPRPVGHAVSIVGALVIGDAAVTAGLIGSPMVMIVALTAVSSFVVPTLYEPIAIVRLLMIILGGTLGLPGVMLAVCVIAVNISASNAFGIPQLAPISPYQGSGWRDTFVRAGWKTLGKRTARVQGVHGSELARRRRRGGK